MRHPLAALVHGKLPVHEFARRRRRGKSPVRQHLSVVGRVLHPVRNARWYVNAILRAQQVCPTLNQHSRAPFHDRNCFAERVRVVGKIGVRLETRGSGAEPVRPAGLGNKGGDPNLRRPGRGHFTAPRAHNRLPQGRRTVCQIASSEK